MNLKTINSYFEAVGEKENRKLKTFYILYNKKSKRSVIFQKGDEEVIKFIKNKLDSPAKKTLYLLLRLNIIQIFLRKIKLNSSVGQLVFFGGQTKIFDFNGKRVISFQRNSGGEKNFIETKKNQKKLAKKGFAPKILELNEKIPFSIEELLEEKIEISNKVIFRKLLKYYQTQKIKKISYFSCISKLEKERGFEKLPSRIKKELERIKNIKKSFYIANVHGDFGKSQILLKNKEILFIDWQIRKGLILEDLFNFFREKENLLRNREFQYILKMFPKEINSNVKEYFLVSQINLFLSNLISYESMLERGSALSFTPNK